jgi:PAS domain S-box-containing protein
MRGVVDAAADYVASISNQTEWAADVDFHALAQVLPNLVFVTDANGQSLYTNARFQDYTGLKAQQLLGSGWLAALHADDQDRASVLWTRSVAAEEPYEAEYRFRSHDGEYRWHLCRAVPVRQGGDIIRWVGTCCDIDDQHCSMGISLSETEAAQVLSAASESTLAKLRVSEADYRSIYEHARTGIAISDFANRFARCNPAFSRIVGYEETELLGTPFADLIYPEDRNINMVKIAQLIAREIESFEIVNRYRHKSGEPVWVHKYISLFFDAENQPTGVIVLATDMTEIKQKEIALVESEERFRTLADTIPALIFATDADGANIYSNPQFFA